MKTKSFFLCLMGAMLFSGMTSCIDNNNKDKGAQGQKDSNYENQAPTYNNTRDDIEQNSDTVAAEKRIPKDPVEVKSKGNAASK